LGTAVIPGRFVPWLGLLAVHGNLAAAPEALLAARLYEVTLSLDIADGSCRLSHRGPLGERNLTLPLRPPCAFVQDSKGEIKAPEYRDLGPARIAVVIGTPILANDPAYAALRTRSDCGAQIQPILVRKGGAVDLLQLHDSIRCARNGMDEKEFWFLAHEH